MDSLSPAPTPPSRRRSGRGRWRLAAVLGVTATPGAMAAFLVSLQARYVTEPAVLFGQGASYLVAGGTALMAVAAGALLAAGLDLRIANGEEPAPAPAEADQPGPELAEDSDSAASRAEQARAARARAEQSKATALHGLMDAVSRARAALDQLRQASDNLESLDDGVFAVDAARIIQFASPAAMAIWGMRAEEVVGRPLLEVFPAMRGGKVVEGIEQVARTGEPSRFEADAAILGRTVLLGIAPLPGGVSVRFRDLTPLKEAEEKLRAAEDRLRVALDGGGMATWDMDLGSGRMRWSPRLCELLGIVPPAEDSARFEDWHRLVHPKDASAVQETWRNAHRSGTFRSIHRITRPDGEQHWLEAYGSMTGDQRGGRFLGVVLDVTARQRAEEQRVLLSREIDHRAKNVLFTIQAIVRLTPRHDPARFATAIEGRIGALSRAHSLLAREGWSAVSLRDIVWSEIGVCGRDARIDLHGPAVQIVPIAVQPLAVALHELAVNAMAHGALSRPGGTVTVRWVPERDGGLAIVWQERGGPVLQGPPTRKGFGRRVIDASAKDQLEGGIAYQWEPAGLTCRITLPASRVELLWEAAGRPGEAPAPQPVPPPAPVPAMPVPGQPAEATLLQGARILVVEDEPLIAAVLTGQLEQWGCRVLGPATSVEEALRLAMDPEGAIDLALMDVNLKGRPSFPAAELLAGRGVPVLYLTGYAGLPQDRLELAAGLLRKPVGSAELQGTLSRILALQPRRAGAASR